MSKVANASTRSLNDINANVCPSTDTYCWWTCSGCVRNDSDVIYCPTVRDWGLTFDDGPSSFTTTLLDFLDRVGVKVTFFVVGSRVVENPQILQRIVRSGHQVGIHTWSHQYLTSQSTEQVIAELQWTAEIIKNVSGVTPKYMRPPFGDVDDRVRNICTQLGYKVVIWDMDTNDWLSDGNPSFQMSWVEGNFTQWVRQSSTTGHISLEHDLYNQTAAQGPLVVPILQNASFNIKPVADCLGFPGIYYKENSTTTTTATPTPTPTPQAVPPPDNVPDSSQNGVSQDSTSQNSNPTTSLALKNSYYFSYIWSFILATVLLSCIYNLS
ncbi:Carbohydrate Esterase Family 4 protein [Gigaspora rosea]|uniref:Carbohydrate Esterase Family 4 protein n=1 Tax=Gigaspora rosea TaxID=44941 RepID=A0A397W0H5_9GLOM|nr:Carbohydrate Esterase Family 4 protein [Gigaspora rosea]